MAWDFSTDPDVAADLDWIRRMVVEEIEPLDLIRSRMSADNWRAVTDPLRQQVKDRGLWAAHLDPALGGGGFGQVRLALMHEILGRTPSAPAIFGNQAPDSGNSELLAVGASDAQKERWLWPLLDGRLTSSFSLTEPHTAGSDPTGIRTRAVRDGDDWVIDGHKWFASNARRADFVLVFAVTDPDADRHRRASMFVVERDTPGMRIVRDVHTMHHPYDGDATRNLGGHAEIRFEGCRVPDSHLIGAPGDAFVLAQKRLNGGRIHHTMRWIGQCRRAFDMLCERAVSRHSHGRVLADHQLVQQMVTESTIDIEALRLLTLKAAWTWDHEGPGAARQAVSQAKYRGARILHDVVDRAIQVHGALGYSTDLPLEEMYRLARNFRLSDGADEVHVQQVAKLALRRYTPVEGWPSEHVPTRRAAAESRYAQWLDRP
ncbi:acyl-CoA dehydrogenase family protein [Streptomyces sp. SID3343]|uniref:acyl-CoA dehydrogenase family protein n=1 Tax=Streptomyces sp. SID3343 TaxID=2690260 RepID=UPI0013686A26|nr:acyl-CoA dehydrogenase family protein [Streptomyces sp. SID3343]MYV97660.1 acyl-CoA dehydrogenase [Streptomyces sp. SID3343]